MLRRDRGDREATTRRGETASGSGLPRAGAVRVVAAVWFGPYALRYYRNIAEVEFPAHPDVLHYNVARLDEQGQPRVVVDPELPFRLDPGEYRVSAVCRDGYILDHWEVTVDSGYRSGFFGRTHPRGGETFVLGVNRGERFTIRPVTDDLATAEKRARDAIDPGKLAALGKAVNEFKSQQEGFVPLFNGENLTGWKVFPEERTGSWKIENGVLVGSGKPSHLFTERGDYGNFHLRMETRIKRSAKGGAVGVFARVPFEDPGMILAPHGSESLYRIPVPKLYDDKAAPPDPAPPSYREGPHVVWGVDNKGEKTRIKQLPADEWFTHELILDGQNITVKTDAGTHGSSSSFIVAGAKSTSGHIALQLFDDWSVVEFRKIEIRNCPRACPRPPRRIVEWPKFKGEWQVQLAVLNDNRCPRRTSTS